MEIVSADKGDRWSAVLYAAEARFDFFLPAPDSEVTFGLLQACLIPFELFSQVNRATWFSIICLVRTWFFKIIFWGDVMPGVVALLTPGELSSPLLSSFSSARLITWHSARNQMTPLDVNFGFRHFCQQMSAELSFDMKCRHRFPSPASLPSPLSNWPVVVTGKLGTWVMEFADPTPLISLPTLTSHKSTLAVTVTWRCHLVLHMSAQISQQAAVLTTLCCRTSRSLREDRWLD